MIIPGHKSIITNMIMVSGYNTQKDQLVITATKNGEIRAMDFGLFKSELKMAASCFIIKN
jgi:hypothetical protein